MRNITLYTWGTITFKVYPLSLKTLNHVTQTDWSKKEIAGAASYREWVGENDEEITMVGEVFPHFFARHIRTMGHGPGNLSSGGLGHLDVLDNMRRLGQAHALVRGDGWHLGWFVIDQLTRGHSHIASDGIGQQISFQARFQRVPVPSDPAAYFPSLWGQLVG